MIHRSIVIRMAYCHTNTRSASQEHNYKAILLKSYICNCYWDGTQENVSLSSFILMDYFYWMKAVLMYSYLVYLCLSITEKTCYRHPLVELWSFFVQCAKCGAIITWSVFSQTPHSRHSIAHPWGQYMGCLLWVLSLSYVLPQLLSAVLFTMSCYIEPLYNGTDCIKFCLPYFCRLQ